MSTLQPICMIGLILLISFLLPYNSSSTDPLNENCMPKQCGALSIAYPFRIKSQQESYCGYPGFELLCLNNSPILNLCNDSYIVSEINYENQSFRITNTVFSGSRLTCGSLTSIHNLTLDDHAYLKFASDYSPVYLLHNCSAAVYRSSGGYREIVCVDGSAKNYSGSIIAAPRLSLTRIAGECGAAISVPYEGGENYTDIPDVLARGISLNWIVPDGCTICEATGGRCGYDQANSEFQCFCRDRLHKVTCHRRSSQKRQLKIMITARKFICIWKKETTYNQKVEDFLVNYGCLAQKRYTYADIKKMTGSFCDKLGEGGYGSVYKGKLIDGRIVAVKLLNQSKGNGEEFINEVASISRTNHVNVVTLFGFCFEGHKRALVYEFMPNGSLEKFTYNEGRNESLATEILFQIAVGIARGLEYLHRGCNTRILHFDIKPHNILLDAKFRPKISDFGLAKSCPQKGSVITMSMARGTVGYIALEVFCRAFGGVSHKSDVYSYGMMVLDMAACRRNVNAVVESTSELYFPDWIYKWLEHGEELNHHGILTPEEYELLRKMVLVSLWCIQTNPSSRPSMSKVVEMLEGELDSLQIPPRPCLCSPPRSPQHLTSSAMNTFSE
ncbi:hypothetical protein Ancab_034789 [Ancistrocladus abbreviatus]